MNEPVEYLEASLAAAPRQALLLGRVQCRFGQGPRDTRFDYRTRRPQNVPIGNGVQIEVEIPNARAGADEKIVLLDVQAVYASVTRPLLKAFQRVIPSPRETKSVSWVQDPAALSFLDVDLSWGAGVTGTSVRLEVPVPPTRQARTNGCTYS